MSFNNPFKKFIVFGSMATGVAASDVGAGTKDIEVAMRNPNTVTANISEIPKGRQEPGAQASVERDSETGLPLYNEIKAEPGEFAPNNDKKGDKEMTN